MLSQLDETWLCLSVYLVLVLRKDVVAFKLNEYSPGKGNSSVRGEEEFPHETGLPHIQILPLVSVIR